MIRNYILGNGETEPYKYPKQVKSAYFRVAIFDFGHIMSMPCDDEYQFVSENGFTYIELFSGFEVCDIIEDKCYYSSGTLYEELANQLMQKRKDPNFEKEYRIRYFGMYKNFILEKWRGSKPQYISSNSKYLISMKYNYKSCETAKDIEELSDAEAAEIKQLEDIEKAKIALRQQDAITKLTIYMESDISKNINNPLNADVYYFYNYG